MINANALKKLTKGKFINALRVKKSVTIFTTICFLITSVLSQGVYAVSSPVLPQILDATGVNNQLIPFNIGKVTDALYSGKGKVVINIQDLHSHEQTQRNISSILSILDAKYGLDKVYVEGAVGNVNTKWLSSIEDKNLKEQILNNLLNSGRLTGSEYFAAKTNKNNLLQGIENKKIYTDNLKRLSKIYDKKNEIESYIPYIKNILEKISERYYSKENIKLNKIIKKNKEGEINAKQYFKYLIRASQKAGVNLKEYGNIILFLKLIEKQEQINAKKTHKEISQLLNELKEKLTYAQYKNLTNKLGNKDLETEFYTDLMKQSEINGIVKNKKYKNAYIFFEYLILNQNLNPIQLSREEKKLLQELNYRFSKNEFEREIYFLNEYAENMSGYLNNKLTAEEYENFEKHIQDFNMLWKKYVDIDAIIDITKYFNLFEQFYKDNIERNRYFIENVIGKLPEEAKRGIRIKSNLNHEQKVIENIEKNKEITVVITGGFHTYGFNKLLEDEGISYINITPNITEETVTAEKKYEKIFKEQKQVLHETLQKMLISQIGETGVLNADILDAVYARDDASAILNEMLKNAGINKKVTGIKKSDGSIEVLIDGEQPIKVSYPEIKNISEEKLADAHKEILKDNENVFIAFQNLQSLFKEIREAERSSAATDTRMLLSKIEKLEELTDVINNAPIKEQLKKRIDSLKSSYAAFGGLDSSTQLKINFIYKTANYIAGILKRDEAGKAALSSKISAVIEAPLMIILPPRQFVLLHYGSERRNIKNAIKENDSEYLRQIGYTTRLEGTKQIMRDTKISFIDSFLNLLGISAAMIFSSVMIGLVSPVFFFGLIPSFIVMVGIPFFANALPTNIGKHLSYNSQQPENTKLTISNSKQKYEVSIHGKQYVTEAVSERQAFNDVIFRITNGNKLEMWKIREEIGGGALPVKLIIEQKNVYPEQTGKFFQTNFKAEPGDYQFTIIVPGLNDIPELRQYQTVYAKSPRQAIYKLCFSLFYAVQNGALKGGKYDDIAIDSQINVRKIADKISKTYEGKKLFEIIKNLKINSPAVKTSAKPSTKAKKQKDGELLFKVVIPELNDTPDLLPYQEVYALNKKEAVRRAILAIILAREREELEGGWYAGIAINKSNLNDILNDVYSQYEDNIDSIVRTEGEQYRQLSILDMPQQEKEADETDGVLESISKMTGRDLSSLKEDISRIIGSDAFLFSEEEKKLPAVEKEKIIKSKILPVLKQLKTYLEGKIPETIGKESVSFGTAGKRGIIGKDFNFNTVALIAQAMSNIINNDHNLPKAVFIGNDTRFLGKLFSILMERIFTANGIKVYTVNEKVATPTIACYLKEVMPGQFAASLNVTASHNPKEYNGVKPNMGDGAPALPSFTKKITEEIQKIQAETAKGKKTILVDEKDNSVLVSDIDEGHFNYLISKLNSLIGIVREKFITQKAGNIAIVVDGKHTALMPVLRRLLDYYAFTNVEIFNDQRDVAFDTYPPEPNEANTKELKERVLNGKSKFGGKTVFGIATDPDGDRFCIYDSNGSFVSPNEVGLIAADKLLSNLIAEMKARKEQGNFSIEEINKFRGVIVKSLVTTFELDLLAEFYAKEFLDIAFGNDEQAKQNYIKKYGAPIYVKTVFVGWKNIADGQKSVESAGERYLLGVESSGGLSVGLYDKDGGLATMMPVLIAAQQEKSFKELLSDARKRTQYKSEFKETAVKFPKEVESDIEKHSGDIADIISTGSEYDEDEHISSSSKISKSDKRNTVADALAETEIFDQPKDRFASLSLEDKIAAIANARKINLLNWIESADIEELSRLLQNLGMPENLKVVGMIKIPNEGIQILIADRNGYKEGDIIKTLLTFRASGTEPLIRVYAESTNENLTNALSSIGENIVRGAYKSFENLPTYAKIMDYVKNNLKTIKELFSQDRTKEKSKQRGTEFSRTLNIGNGQSLFFDFSKTNIDENLFELLINLLKSTNVKKKINDMFAGKKINWTEGRAVLHTALRNTSDTPVFVEGTDKNVMNDVNAVLQKMKSFSDKLISGDWKGVTGKPITDVVSIGIGGSDLGPRMATDALSTFKKGPNVHFVSNVDPNDINSVLNSLGLNPETTLFIIESKTFTTEETLSNANLAKKWITSRLGENSDVISKHFVAVSTNKEKVAEFGIDTNNMFEFWDWVGGRYSVWSAVGLPLMCSIGYDNFMEFLDGAHQMDINFKTAPYEQNIPMIMAMLNILERNFLNRNSYAILPYNKYLKLFTSHIQQVYMESLGKSVNSKGDRISYATGSEIYGTAGTDAQHSYLQEHHQGTDIIPVDFIGFAQTNIADEDMQISHRRLLANLFAQAKAMAFGRTYEETVQKLTEEGKDETTAKREAKDQIFDGNRPSTIMMFDKLTPRSLGALIALYEDMVATLGIVWDINTFDQMGVQLGKVNAKSIFGALRGDQITSDSSTQNLIDLVLSSDRLTLPGAYRISKILSNIIAKIIYAKDYAADVNKYIEKKRILEEKTVAVLEAPLMMILTPTLFVKLHYKNRQYISNFHDIKGYDTRLEGAKEIKKQTVKMFFKSLLISEAAVLPVSMALYFMALIVTPITPAILVPLAIAIIASLGKNRDSHFDYNLKHSANKLDINEARSDTDSVLEDILDNLSDSKSDAELKSDILKMVEAGFSKKSIIKLMEQYLSLRNGDIPESIYDKKNEIKFGTAGVRGILADEFDFFDAAIITQSIANSIKNTATGQNIKVQDIKVLVGGDSRFLSRQFTEIVSKIFAANGIEVTVSSEDVPSPTISYTTRKEGFTLSVNITASHNPKEHNGFKITLGDGGQAGTEITSLIETGINDIQNKLSAGVRSDEVIKIVKSSPKIKFNDMKDKFISAFIEMITKISGISDIKELETFRKKAAKWTIIVDPKNGATKKYYPEILKYFGFNVVMMNDERDVTFSDQKPEPSAANMTQLINMVKNKAKGGTIKLLGISTDVDGDRFGTVDKDGTFITANEIGLILEQERIERELNLLIDKVVKGEIPLTDFIKKKIIIARNLATTHAINYLAENLSNEIFIKRFGELKQIAEKQGITLDVKNLINNVRVEEVNVGFKYMAALKHKTEDEGNLFLLAIESSGGISVAEWIYDKCGFLANIMLLMTLVNTDNQPKNILYDIYKRINYAPVFIESAVRFQEIVEQEKPALSPVDAKAEAQRRQNEFKAWSETATIDDINKLIGDIDKNISAIKIQKIGSGETFEGIKVILSDNSWFLLRLSGTEPLVRVFVETQKEKLSEQLSKRGEDIVKGKYKEGMSAGKKNGAEILKDIIKNSLESLQRLALSLVFKENIEYTIVAQADDLARIKRAEELSKAGIKVNLVLTGNTALIQETTSRLSTQDNKLAFGLINKVSEKLTVYGYESIPNQEITEQQGLTAMLRYINANASYSIKILDLTSGIENISTSDLEDVSKEMFTTVGVDKTAMTLFADALKQKLKRTNDMIIKPSVVAANISSEQIDEYDKADIESACEQGVTTIVISVNDKILSDKGESIKKILQTAHQNGLKVMFNYVLDLKTVKIDDLLKWTGELNDRLSSFRNAGGIEGIKLDLSNNGELASTFAMISLLVKLSKIVNEQNVGSFLAVKMPAEISTAEYGNIFAQNNIKLIVDYNNDFAKQGVSLLKAEDVIIDITADSNEIINQSKLSNIFENMKVSMVSLDSSILDAIKTNDGSFSFREMTVEKLIISIFETTPEGQTIKGINKGRNFVSNRNISLSNEQLQALYDMHAKEENASVSDINGLLNSEFKENTSKYELSGIITGILEAAELKSLSADNVIVFKNPEYNNLLMKALVDYRTSRGQEVSFKYDANKNIEDVLKPEMFRQEYRDRINEIYQILNGQYKDKDDVVINILSSLNDDRALTSSERTIVLEGLLLMLLGYTNQKTIKVNSENINNIANIKALLSAA